MKITNLILCSVLTLLCASTLYAQKTERRRGKYLRTEVIKTDKTDSFSLSLGQGQASFPCLEFKSISVLKHHEVRLYEVLLEVVNENKGEGITPRGSIEYILVPGETYKGEKSEREEIVVNGPLADTMLTINGKSVMTDNKGVYLDSSQWILAHFDDMRQKSLNLVAEHKTLGKKNLVITRNLIKRESAEMPDVPQATGGDLLDSFRQNYTQLRISGVDGMKVTFTAPEKGKAGETIVLTAQVSNAGSRPICNLLGRTFCSDSGIDGKMFYFGTIQPGNKVVFSRLVTLPEKKAGPYFGCLAFWSILGPAPAKMCNFKIDVE